MDIISIALSQYGITEDSVGDNEEILKYFHCIGHDWVKTDETAWCSAFVNWVAKTSGYAHTKKLNARSWLDVGTSIDDPILGDIVVLWRVSPDSWQGHVGFYINDTKDHIYILGGNQSNSVCIKPYPKGRLLGYRRLTQ